MQDEKFYIQEAADFLEIPVSNLKLGRANGTGPVFMKLSKRIIYLKSDLIEWRESRRMKKTVRRKTN